ncbi:hypothetical protein ABIA06_005357 [Bradyrhizobium yuanmingense]|uniref:hypothetical protein n=1 Tax=Bradyrhizobium yuanmingense TaxID=108015 RepID=UPI003517A464
MVNNPTTAQEAWGCCAEYLSGTAGWERSNVEERVRETAQFKALGVSDFRTKAARELRDISYVLRGISFLHQASRYRGKANYRDAIYLAYGTSVPNQLSGFVDDMLVVLKGFAAMASGLRRRVLSVSGLPVGRPRQAASNGMRLRRRANSRWPDTNACRRLACGMQARRGNRLLS